jgi:hypothetical protein
MIGFVLKEIPLSTVDTSRLELKELKEIFHYG